MRLWSSNNRLDKLYQQLQTLFSKKGTRYYGFTGTIRGSIALDVETYHGTVVAVWFRCQPVPFNQTEVSQDRAIEMESMCERLKEEGLELHGLDIKDGEPSA